MVPIENLLILPDLHIYANHKQQVDGIDLRSWSAVMKFVADHKWDRVVQIGDFMDMNCLSSHNKNNLRAVEGLRLVRDYIAGERILDELEAALKHKSPDAQITILEGNHDAWVEKWIDANPAVEGFFEVERGLHLQERGIEWFRSWSETNPDKKIYKVGKLGLMHGLYVNKYHANKTVQALGSNVIYGHTHDIQEHPIEQLGKNKTIMAKSIGCLNKYDMPYLRGRPTKWQQGFSVVRFQPNGFFNEYTIKIFNNKFICPFGKLYQP